MDPDEDPDSVPDPAQIIDPISDQVTDQVTDPVTDPASDPVPNPIADQVADQVIDQITDPATEPALIPVPDLNMESVSDSAKDSATTAGNEQKKEGEAAGKPTRQRSSAAQLRITKDISELNLPKTCQMDLADPDDLLNFKINIAPDEGFYKGGRFIFSFKVSSNYPHEPPKVKCETMVYHPNIDLEGNVCLNILREDWKPVLTINSIVYGIQYLFLEPNPEDPLNKEAAEMLQSNKRLFEQNVRKAMAGGYVGTTYFERCVK